MPLLPDLLGKRYRNIKHIKDSLILVNNDITVCYQWALISKLVISVFCFKYSICPASQCYNRTLLYSLLFKKCLLLEKSEEWVSPF